MAFLRANHGTYSNPDTQAGWPEQGFLGNVVLLFVKYEISFPLVNYYVSPALHFSS